MHPLPPAPPPLPSAISVTATGRFGAVVGEADRIVVVDTETTGVFPSDRVVEVALVTLDLDGQIINEFDTLIDPRRDVGPTWIYGITASMLADAPTFEDVCGQLAVRLHGAVIAADNLPFDARMLAGEYGRLGVEVQLPAGLDTLALTGARLADACSAYGVRLNGAHAAGGSAGDRPALVALAERCDGFDCLPVVLPTGLAPWGRMLRRDPQPATRSVVQGGGGVGQRWWPRVMEQAPESTHGDGFVPTSEVDEVRWLPLAQAASACSWQQDRAVLAAFAVLPAQGEP